ncbi:DNA-formamidopyrimidine glycosylase [Candidatus Azambacteria bacterium RIFCSPHIGHO2_02_46_12]|uniref:DNA-formamidopyrimidine glycosylase n=1 Tax=Candidatus Azambacteria bacterium RIFCSPHIGHO2_02_46_12 TaxID=1797295 RepID=A0A1F5BKC3_9BACT|nr:MAG: DNA-formamidopyrimidine glycosylase [Candidatus Azambacteria bacterium RIFCSPHIGHO2_02_46_12]
MPELPEVETIVRDLKKKIVGRKIIDVWTDWPKTVKFPKKTDKFKREIIGRKIEKIERRGKNILIFLSGGKLLLVHQKLTGHLLVGRWKIEDNIPRPLMKGALEDKVNNYIHFIFFLDDENQLALSDLRKFAKIMAGAEDEIKKFPDLKNLGSEPLDKKFTFERFKDRFSGKKGKIKQVLMNQKIIAGIGNIYSDEILWQAGVYPLKEVQKLKENELKAIYRSMRDIFKKAIGLRGDSMSDFRDTAGRKGRYQEFHKAYQRTGEPCFRDGTTIKRFKLGGRSGHYCPTCQRLTNN